jgi:hypothetical protein
MRCHLAYSNTKSKIKTEYLRCVARKTSVKIQVDPISALHEVSLMNMILSVPNEVAAQAKLVKHKAEEMELARNAAIDPATVAALGSALPLEEHWDDPRWRALAEKHLR